MIILRWLILGWLVEHIPNGCALSHLCTGPENEDEAWKVLDAAGITIAVASDVLPCLRNMRKYLKDH